MNPTPPAARPLRARLRHWVSFASPTGAAALAHLAADPPGVRGVGPGVPAWALTPKRLALGLALAWTTFAVLTLHSFGLTSDSPSLFYAGDRHLFWLLHPSIPNALNFLGSDPPGFHTSFFRFPEPADPFHYPVFPGFVAAVTSALFHDGLGWLGALDGHHLGLALLQAVNLYIFARYAMSLFGVTAGASATLALAFFPSILGHAINNAKDLPCTVLYGCALMAAALGLLRRDARHLLACGVLTGVALSSKLNAAFALITLVLWTPAVYALCLRRDAPRLRFLGAFLGLSYGLPVALIGLLNLGTPRPFLSLVLATSALLLPVAVDLIRGRGDVGVGLLAVYVAIPLVAAATFVVLWPWLWAGQAFTFWQRLSIYADGMIRFSTSPRPAPTGYALRCLVFMTPPLVLAAAVVGVGSGLRGSRDLWRELRAPAVAPDWPGASLREDRGEARWLLFVLLLLWIALPLVRISVPHSMFYDANRHFLEYIPALCLLSGLGVAALVSVLRGWRSLPLQRAGFSALLAAALGAFAIPIARYHPFEVTYFNWLAGGLGGAQRDALLYVPGEDWRSPGTEGDYWHASLRDFLGHVGSLVPPSAVLGVCGTMYKQAVANWEGEPLQYADPHELGTYLYVAPRESFCGWAHIRDLESQRPVLLRVVRDGGLIYEILGPEVPYPLPPVSAPTRYDSPLTLRAAS